MRTAQARRHAEAAQRRTAPQRAEAPPNLHHLGDRDFERLAQFIQDKSGIKMPASKKTMLEARLRRRVLSLGMGSFADYCHYLFHQGGLNTETDSLIDAVTTNKTDFFRESEHFRFLSDKAAPGLLAEFAELNRSPLKVWSAACSTGAEAYTLAMVLSEMSPALPGFSILGTDICTDVLKTAAGAIYPSSMAAPIPLPLRQRYLLRSKDPRTQDAFRIAPELRRSVRFGRLNLMDASYGVDTGMHVIFCRNALIYFDRQAQRKVTSQLCRHLTPGGYLFLGHAESVTGFDLPLQQVGATIFRRL